MASRADTLLKTYREKRDFAATAEPKGGAGSRKGRSAPIFMVQKHDATRLHFDFRFEHDGVLKSWAVTRGPSLDPSDKRLAVHVEDHPLDYATFEGTIPKGEYGGGTVMLWDTGTYEPIEPIDAGLAKGSLKLRLFGERMKGGWALVRMKGKPGEKRENWLLIKENDAHADREHVLVDEATTSISTGRTMEEIAAGKAAGKPERKSRAKAAKPAQRGGKLPAFVEPQLATLVDDVPQGRGWVFELKYDGYRCMAALSGDAVRLYSRNGHDWSEQFGALVPYFKELGADGALIDGEVYALDEAGKTSFSTLKARLSDGGPLMFFAFDLLALGGKSLQKLTLAERQEKLAALLGKKGEGPIQLSPTIAEKGQEVFDAVCKAGQEGIIAKRADAPYRSGRGKDWLKIKCTQRQEFIIVGWTPSTRRKGVFASLLIATEEDGALVYRGRVGTGFTEASRAELQAQLEALGIDKAPLAGTPRAIARGAHWVKPTLLAEIAYTEVTPDGSLRHPSFLGLREDKPAKAIALDTPVKAKPKAKAPAKSKKTAEPATLREADGLAAAEAAGVKVTSPDRVLFPEQGVTKAKLMAYYAAVADIMLPLVADHPLSLVRCPGGRAKQCFFQKHDTGGFNAALKSVELTEGSGEVEDYFYIDTLGGLLAGVQMGVLEFHLWGSRRDRVEKPDRMIFDIDPDEGLGFDAVKDAAVDIRDRLERLGLQSFPMVTGGKGVHVIVPLARRVEWPDVKAFAKGFAQTAAGEAPERYTATMSKAKRKGRLFIDYLRNERGSTAIAPFSTRSRPGAPVAVPVDWEELADLEAANGFTLESAVAQSRLPFWAGYGDASQALTKAMVKAVG